MEHHERVFSPSPGAARAAREFLRDVLATQRMDGFGEVTELLTTELVSNVVDHVGSVITVRVDASAGSLRVEVDDTSTDAPVLRRRDASTPRGNGMLLVDGLADRWGVEARAAGKTVWFELDASTATEEVHGDDA